MCRAIERIGDGERRRALRLGAVCAYAMGMDEVRAHVIEWEEWEAGRQAEFLRMLFAW